MIQKEETIDDFHKKYRIIQNHLTENAPFENGLFETYGEELGYVYTQVPTKRVWTVIDSDGWYGIISGFHFINRLGFLVTEQEWEKEDEQYVIADEGPVNDWFFDLTVEQQKSLFPELKLDPNKDEEDQLEDAWHDKCVDEKEEIMNKYKSNI